MRLCYRRHLQQTPICTYTAALVLCWSIHPPHNHRNIMLFFLQVPSTVLTSLVAVSNDTEFFLAAKPDTGWVCLCGRQGSSGCKKKEKKKKNQHLGVKRIQIGNVCTRNACNGEMELADLIGKTAGMQVQLFFQRLPAPGLIDWCKVLFFSRLLQ